MEDEFEESVSIAMDRMSSADFFGEVCTVVCDVSDREHSFRFELGFTGS
jgi:hypothetical protein